MILEKIIPEINFSMPVFGMGTWMLGGKLEPSPDRCERSDTDSIVRAIDAGLTHIDTAEIYAGGYAEEAIAKAISGYDRSTLFLVSKVSSAHLRYNDLIESAKQSLARLKTDYLDLYLIHEPNPNIPMEETMNAMAYLKDNGYILNIGVSNFSTERVKAAQKLIDAPIVANQVHYNLKFREPEILGLLEYCQATNMMLIAWRPIQKGLLSTGGIPILDEMCEKYAKSPAQIAINWLISQPNVVTLSTMRTLEHLEENLGALGWEMEAEDIEKLRSLFPEQQTISDVPLISSVE
ncbi:aldo/keto reductase [Roseofilum reptotaenium CS-1145]|uniref:NADP-dependent oxidoreductase domain-containing protein n=2 Tax=Roseofilum TaxID=1233426 RepID=A0A1L9QVA0_9CYAN|nr:aldo/keto reductase [Roseofilum reptotaenium CS-1145]OJJ26611.1 hypothetical protein BI308_05840 [Roseofilum reptotaenium AO1-A]